MHEPRLHRSRSHRLASSSGRLAMLAAMRRILRTSYDVGGDAPDFAHELSPSIAANSSSNSVSTTLSA